jgi:outer membrane receptor protein involved in Fe transport
VIYGAEARLRHRIGREESPWSAEGRLAYAHGRQYDDTVDVGSGEMPFYDVPWRRVPPLFGTAALQWQRLDQKRVKWAELAVHFADGQDDLHPDDITDPRIDPNGTPGWYTVNLDVGGKLGADADWSFGLHNILDERYRIHGSGFDSAGRGFAVTLDWRP